MTSTKPKKSESEDYSWHTMAEACAILKCSPRKIYELQRAGRLEIVKFDSQNRITERSLQRLLSEIFAEGERNATRRD